MKKKKASIPGSISVASGANTTINFTGDLSSTSTSSTLFLNQYSRELQGVEFIQNDEGNFMEITYKLAQSLTYTVTWNINPPQRMIKERYGVVNGKMQLIKTIQGEETSGYYVPSSVEWEE